MCSKILLLFFGLLFGSYLTGNAQSSKIDSLQKILTNSKEDTVRANTLNALADEFKRSDPDTSLFFAKMALSLSIKINFSIGIAEANLWMGNALASLGKNDEGIHCLEQSIALINSGPSLKNSASGMRILGFAHHRLGSTYFYMSNYSRALKEFNAAVKVREESGDKKGQADSHNNLGNTCRAQGNYPLALREYFISLKLREEIADKKGIAMSHNNIGIIYFDQGHYQQALNEYFSALKIQKELKDMKSIAGSHNNIGSVYGAQKKNEEALEEFLLALRFFEEIGDKYSIAHTHNNLGSSYAEMGRYADALREHEVSLKIREEIGNQEGASDSYFDIATVHFKTGRLKEAVAFVKKSIVLAKEIGAKEHLRYAYQLLASCDSAQGNFKDAYIDYQNYISYRDGLINEENTKKSVQTEMQYDFDKKEAIADAEHKKEMENQKIITNAENKKQRIIIWSVIGGLLLFIVFSIFISRALRLAQKQKRIIETQKMDIANAFKNIEFVSEIGQKITSTLSLEEVIAILHGHINNVMDASALVIYLLNPEKNCLEIKYTIGKHGGVIAQSIPLDSKESFCVWSFNNKKEVLINDVERDYIKYLSSYYWSAIPNSEIIQSFINIPLIVGGNAIGVISVQSFNKDVYSKEDMEVLKSLASFMSVAFNNADAYSQLSSAKENLLSQKRIIEEKNKDITDSINYARRIQKAMLPHRRDIWTSFPQSFVLYKPKDIVSGDFYFFHPKGRISFIAVADCTGHGVPGAFMSMIGSNKLEDAVKASSDTSEILSLLNKGVKTALKQSGEDDGSTRDGMDIAICSVDTESRIVKYAGANRSIWIIRKDSKEVEEMKATKKAIGGFTEDSQHFDTHEIRLKEGDTIYLSTDGYGDTFGASGKKMMTKRFKGVLVSIQDMSMKDQEKHLDDFVENWMGDTEQVDDILVIGIRV